MQDIEISNGQAAPTNQVGIRVTERSEAYRRNLVRLLEDNVDLRELVRDRAVAEQRYETARQRRWKKTTEH
jgi:outer membrane usher protein FimD/PapC